MATGGGESSNHVFRVWRAIPALGWICLAYHGYTLLYAAGLVDIVLYPKVVEFRAATPQSIEFCGLMIVLSALVIGVGFQRILVSSTGIEFRCPFRRRSVAWRDVHRCRIRPNLGDIEIRTAGTCIRIDYRFASSRAEIVRLLRMHIPSHLVNG